MRLTYRNETYNPDTELALLALLFWLRIGDAASWRAPWRVADANR